MARVILDDKSTVVKYIDGHTHPPSERYDDKTIQSEKRKKHQTKQIVDNKFSYVMSTDITFVKSQTRNGNILIFDEHSYCLDGLNGPKKLSRWKCSTHSNKGCKARVTLHNNSEVIKYTGRHTHPSSNRRDETKQTDNSDKLKTGVSDGNKSTYVTISDDDDDDDYDADEDIEIE